MPVTNKVLYVGFDLLLTLQAAISKREHDQTREMNLGLPSFALWVELSNFTPFTFNILLLGFTLSISEDVMTQYLSQSRGKRQA